MSVWIFCCGVDFDNCLLRYFLMLYELLFKWHAFGAAAVYACSQAV